MKSAAKLGLSVGVVALAALGAAQAGDTSAAGAGASFKDLDKNQDGRVSMVEAQPQETLRSSFAALDKNADGYLSQTEFTGWRSDKAPGAGRSAPTAPSAPPAPDSGAATRSNPEVNQ